MASVSVGDIVHIVETDGSKVLAQVIELGKDAHEEVVAFVHRLEHDGIAYVTRQTADLEAGDKPVPIVQPVSTSTGTGGPTTSVGTSTLDTLKGGA